MITIHGRIEMEYGAFVRANKYIQGEKTPKERREGCFKPDLGQRFHEAFSKKIGLSYFIDKESEIFDPKQKYPDHHDSGGVSYITSFEEGATLTVDGLKVNLIPWCIYSFEESNCHNSEGCLFMCKPTPKHLQR